LLRTANFLITFALSKLKEKGQAVQGSWEVSGANEHAVTYIRTKGDVVEEFRVEKEKIRQ